MAILLPAILTNIATPIGGFISYRFIADYSDDVIAGFAVVGRVVPVAFCLLFSLSGAVGPIIGQNFGALKFDRIRITIKQATLFALAYTLAIWPILYLLNGPIGDAFNLTMCAGFLPPYCPLFSSSTACFSSAMPPATILVGPPGRP